MAADSVDERYSGTTFAIQEEVRHGALLLLLPSHLLLLLLLGGVE